MSDFDIKLELAESLASELSAVLYAGRCDRCNFPLMMILRQGMPFCGLCTTKRIRATDARAILLRAKMLEKGIIIPRESCYRATSDMIYDPWTPIISNETSGPFASGMPL